MDSVDKRVMFEGVRIDLLNRGEQSLLHQLFEFSEGREVAEGGACEVVEA